MQSDATKTRSSGGLRPALGWLTDSRLAVLFTTPTLLILLFIAIYPLVWSLSASFTNRTMSMPQEEIEYIGVDNYTELLTEDRPVGAFCGHRRDCGAEYRD